MSDTHPYFSAKIFPHRSLSPEAFRLLFLVLGASFFVIGLLFFTLGAWPVVGFMGLELAALYWGFRVSYRQAKGYERIEVWRNDTRLTRVCPKGIERESSAFPTAWLQVVNEEAEDDPQPLYLRSHGRQVAFGRDLTPQERSALAQALRQALHKARSASW